MSSLGGRRAIMISLILSTCGAGAPRAHAQSWAEHWFDNVTYTSPGSFEDQARGYVTAGGFSGRVDVHNDYLMSVTLPKARRRSSATQPAINRRQKTMRSSRLKRKRRIGACSTRAGPTRSVTFIPTSAFTASGLIGGSRSSATPASVSTISS